MGKPFLASPSSVPNLGFDNDNVVVDTDAAIVDLDSRLNSFFVKRDNRFDLPTPESPIYQYHLIQVVVVIFCSVTISRHLYLFLFHTLCLSEYSPTKSDRINITLLLLCSMLRLILRERVQMNLRIGNDFRDQRYVSYQQHIYPCHLILFVCSFLWAWAWAWTCGSSSGLVQLIWVQTSDCQFFFFFWSNYILKFIIQ